ncbi:MAG TPA: glycosyltransferase family 2 protein [Polyangiaceae bacterium]|nr:glycosyltransferase family 2 protein [Polyangiaceae bacterium]
MNPEALAKTSRAGAGQRVLAILPALNEAGNIETVVRELRALTPQPDVLVIDDGSTDDTAAIAKRAGAAVLKMPFNSGIGATVQAGLTYAVRYEYDIVARFDGDGQHDPLALDRLRVPIDEDRADFVLGSRYIEQAGFKSTALRRLGSWWFGVLLRPVMRMRITDPTSGCWVANSRAVRVLYAEYSYDYPEVDSLVRLSRCGCRVAEVPVQMRQREVGESSIFGLKVPYYMLKVTLALLIAWLRPADPLPAGSFPRAPGP